MDETAPQRLSRWFDVHAARLALYARNWLDRAAAEDVVQEVFLRLVTKPIEPQSEKAWLFRSVRHMAISEQRGRRRRKRREQTVAHSRQDWFETNPEDLIDAATAQRAMAVLPSDQREVILLRIWGGLSLAEIARVTELPVSTLFSRYKTGLQEIRKTMETSCRKKTD